MTTDEKIQHSVQFVFEAMKPRVSEVDMQRIKDAFAFASEAHKDQLRKSGEPYIIHPIAVARIVAEELELGANPVIAAFLHDVVEDTPHTIDEIRSLFGDDVAFLVDVVTKRKKTQESMSKQVENFKQILDSVHYDIRALMIKLADRLHNMRTLASMKPDKQMKIAGETDFFYAPLANRLGLYRVKSELENLSFSFRCPREYEQLSLQLEQDKKETEDAVRNFINEVDEILKGKNIKARIEVRYRKPYSIWRDMHNDHVDFAHVEFKHYIRVIYYPAGGWSEKDTSLFIYSVLTDRFKERPGSVSNYIDNPKENGYQSFHVKLLGRIGVWEELHISSERMLRNSRLGCIDKSNEETMNQWLGKLREHLKDMAEEKIEGFMEGVSSSFYNEDIFVLTPKGRVIQLPKDATAIDFAYELHTDIGDHAKYARINGKLSSVKATLHRGDCVEIGISDDMEPQRDWLDCVKTYKASRHLRTVLRDRNESEYERCPICNPLPGDEVIGFKDANGHITMHTRHCPEAIKLASENGDSIVAIDFDSSPDIVYPVRISIIAIDRYHLLRDIITCLSDDLHLSIDRLRTATSDQIVHCTIDFTVHTADEISKAINGIASIRDVDEVQILQLQ